MFRFVKIMKSVSSLVDVAKRAGVSISTVSRTINSTGKISAKTQSLVRKAMRELNYRPNRVARRLRSRRGNSGLLGLIIPNIQNQFFADMARGVEDVAYANGFAVILCNYDEDPGKELFYLDVMQSESVDGIIIPPLHDNDMAVRKVAQSGLPVVCVDRTLKDFDLDKVEVDNRRGARDAVRYLIEKGHKRIAIITGPRQSSTGRDRLSGYRDAHAEAGLEVDEELVCHGDFKESCGNECTGKLLDLPNPPTALFTCNNLMTIGALHAVANRGVKIPDQLAIVGFDDMAMADVFSPPLTMVSQPAYEVGKEAAELLLRRIKNPGKPTAGLLLKPKLIVRDSVMIR